MPAGIFYLKMFSSSNTEYFKVFYYESSHCSADCEYAFDLFGV